jgi:malonyl-CoA decarboxylase
MEPNKVTVKRMETLADLFDKIRSKDDPPPAVLIRFQDEYQDIPREERIRFFEALLRRFETPKKEIEEDLRALLAAAEGDPIRWSRALGSLRRKLESPRMRAFRRFMNLSGGLKFLLDFRADVLSIQRQATMDLGPLDEEIAHLFNSWFQQGFLFLQEITQESSYRQIRFLKDHDLVHPMASIEEMGNRLGEDRRCFSLYHRAMPEEPVVFIEVALTRGIARSIHEVIEKAAEKPEKKTEPDTAIFYSINNTQNGLAGLGLGKVLIFQVVDALKKDNPDIRTFSTLSPIPGFWERYLKRVLQNGEVPFALKPEKVEEFFSPKVRQRIMEKHAVESGTPAESFGKALAGILSIPGWLDDSEYAQMLKKPLTEITYFYVAQEKDKQGKPLNPVANFHMGNGATVTVRNVNFAANRFQRGLDESCGMMVNYVYSMTWLQQIGRTMQSLLPWKV